MSGAPFTHPRALTDAQAALAASAAAQAKAKAANEAHTRGLLRTGQQICGQLVSTAGLYNEAGQLVGLAFTTVGTKGEADARRLAACWNACEGVPTEHLESCAHWSDIVKAPPLQHCAHIPAEAARIGAALDSESLEQGEPS